MSDTPNPHPQIDALRAMQETFTTAQLHTIAEHCKRIAARGWGSVQIVFDNHRPDVIAWTESDKLPRE